MKYILLFLLNLKFYYFAGIERGIRY